MEETLLKLDVYCLAHDLLIRIHKMSLTLPSIERFEEASQIRRSSKRVSACIVEGHTLRKYRGLYLNFLYRALASADETQEHLRILHETGSLPDTAVFQPLMNDSKNLSGKLYRFILAVEARTEPPNFVNRAPMDGGPVDGEDPAFEE